MAGSSAGARTEFAEHGVQFNLDWTHYVQGIVEGGRYRTTQYGEHVDLPVSVHLMRMAVMQSAMITLRAESRCGSSVNGQAGPVLPVNTAAFFPLTDELDESAPIALTNRYYTTFLSPHSAVILGKLDTLDADLYEFASGRGKSQFMHANFLFNSVAALRLPYSTLGGAVARIPNRHASVKVSLVNTVDSSTTTGFDDFGDGLTASAEANFQYRLGDLPGGCNIGGLYSFD